MTMADKSIAPVNDSYRSTVEESETEQHVYPGGIRLASIMTALVFCMFLASLDVTIISTAIPSITGDFHSVEDVGWYGSAMFFPVAATQSFWGKAFKYFPVKVVYLISILVFEIGSLICALSTNSATFIAGRAITGTGAAGTFSGSFLVIALSSEAKIRPALHSALSATFAVASIIGPLIGGALTQNISWRWCFYINLPFGAVAVAAFIFAFSPPDQEEARSVAFKEKILQMDLPGVVLVSAAVICFTLSMRWAGVEKPWSSGEVIGTLVGTGVLLIAFVFNEWYQGDKAFLTSKILKQRTLRTAGTFELLISGSFYIGLFYLPIYFQAVRGVSALSSGVRLIPLILGLTLTQIAVGITITATGHFMPFMVTGPVLAAVGNGLLMLLDEESPSSAWIGYQILTGIGAGACLTIPMMLSQVMVAEEDIAIATAAMIFCQATGGAFAIAAAQGIFQNQLAKALSMFAPTIDPLTILSAGATDNALAKLPAEVIPGIVHSYVRSLRYVFALGIPISGIAFIVCFFQPWIKYHDPHKESSAEGDDTNRDVQSAGEKDLPDK